MRVGGCSHSHPRMYTAAFVGWTRAVSFVLRFGQTVAVTQITMVASNNQTGTKRPPGDSAVPLGPQG